MMAGEDTIKNTALREVREETGYELAANGELISLGYFFSSPGFTDERGYFFLARPVQPCAEGPDREESESILDCRGFNSEEIRRMIADNEIRDANTLRHLRDAHCSRSFVARAASMTYHSAVSIDTWLQPGATTRVPRKPFQRLLFEFKTVKTVCRSFRWLHLAEARC